MGYHPESLAGVTAPRRLNITFHSKAVVATDKETLRVMVKDATDTKVDIDVTRMLTMENGIEID
jgi:hypothetical protein